MGEIRQPETDTRSSRAVRKMPGLSILCPIHEQQNACAMRLTGSIEVVRQEGFEPPTLAFEDKRGILSIC